jgi:uncharacterized delta-60 repeat protein
MWDVSKWLLSCSVLGLCVACGGHNQETGNPRYDTLQFFQSVSGTGKDGYYGVAFDRAGKVLATGYVANNAEANADHAVLVSRFLSTGALDTSFGTRGVVTLNVRVGGKGQETGRAVAVQSTGHILVAAVAEHDVTATGAALTDRDIVLIRFNADGTKDSSFGTNGMVVLDLSTGGSSDAAATSFSNADTVYNMEILADDSIVLHGNMRALAGADASRMDTDMVVVKLTSSGARDTSFGTNGLYVLDIDQQNNSAKNMHVQSDGSIVASGYAKTPSVNNTTQPVLYKLTPAGMLDTSFGVNGVFHASVLVAATEVYDFAPQGNQWVTVGYGRAAETETLDWVSLRFNNAGVLDNTWGSSGVVRIDAQNFNDNGRACVALPGNRIMMVGGARTSESTLDTMLAVVDNQGGYDFDFGTQGRFLKDLGGDEDMLWDVAISSDARLVAAVGVRGFKNDTEKDNDDAVLVLIPLSAEF